MIELTYDKTVELLREAVAERGEGYVYTTPDGRVGDGMLNCLYVHQVDANGDSVDPTPGCIVGWVLHKAGVPLEVLAQHESSPADFLVSRLIGSGALSAEDGVVTLLRNVQVSQDEGNPWGVAVEGAIARAATTES